MRTLFLDYFAQSLVLGLAILALLAAAPLLQKRYSGRWFCRAWLALAVLLVLPLRGEALAMEADVRELRRLKNRLPGARIVLADCGMTADARALAAYLADREQGVALADGAVIDLGEHNHTKEEEYGRAGHL